MKRLSKKDLLIISLSFILILIASSTAMHGMILKDISYEKVLAENPIIFGFSSIGYVLTFPIFTLFSAPLHLLSLLGVNLAYNIFFEITPILTAGIYSLLIMFALAMNNARNKK